MARAKIDWEAVELDYRAGVKTLRTMAGEHGCAESAIRKKAKEQNWSRDLEEKVRQRAQEKVRKAEVRAQVRTELEPTERMQIEVMAEVQADVVLSHRRQIGRSRNLTMKLLDELETQCDNPDLLAQLGDEFIGPPITGNDPEDRAAERDRRRLREAFDKAINLSNRAGTLKTLADALKTLVALEREAFNITNGDQQQGGRLEDFLDQLA